MSYIITYYQPSGLFVVVSWISFLIPPDIVPGNNQSTSLKKCLTCKKGIIKIRVEIMLTKLGKGSRLLLRVMKRKIISSFLSKFAILVHSKSISLTVGVGRVFSMSLKLMSISYFVAHSQYQTRVNGSDHV